MKLQKQISILMTVILLSANLPLTAAAEEIQAEEDISLTADIVATESSVTVVNKYLDVEFSVTSQWEDGFNGEITLINTSDAIIENWQIEMEFPQEISNIWNGIIVSHEDTVYNIKNPGGNYNVNIPVGGSVTFGFTGAYEDEIIAPSNVKLVSGKSETGSEKYTVEYTLLNDWGDGYTAQIVINNNTDEPMEAWQLEFDFDREISSIWNAVIDSHTDNRYCVSNAGYNSVIPANGSVFFGFNGTGGNSADEPENYVLLCSGNAVVSGDDKEIDYEKDTDGDNIPDWIEEILGTNIDKVDTDDDGLSDFDEVMYTGTDPLKYDTDDDEICDADEDTDGDGLTNGEEISIGTNPSNKDTDDDTLSDYDELYVYNTKPLKYDTDDDTLSDGDELLLGLNPNKQDTDDDGKKDCDEKIEQTLKESIDCEQLQGITDICITMSVSGVIDNCVNIENMYNRNMLSTDLVGITGAPIDITCTQEFDFAEISFIYDESKLDISPENLGILWYNEEDQFYEVMDAILNEETHTITMTTTHFSEYTVVDLNAWFEVWEEKIDYGSASITEMNANWNGKVVTAQQLCDEYNSFFGFDKGITLDYVLGACENGNIYAWFGTISLSLSNGETVNYPCLFMALKEFAGVGFTTGELSTLFPVPICGGWVVSYLNGSVNYEFPYYEEYGNIWPAKSDVVGYTGTLYNNAKFFVPDGQVDTTDDDEDGLYDIYELTGMRIANGQVIYTKTNTDAAEEENETFGRDTDGDGLLDGEEIIKYDTERGYFIMNSDPVNIDSDGDKILDKYYVQSEKSNYYNFADPNPFVKDINEIALKDDFFSVDYEYLDNAPENWSEIRNNSKIESYGGYQGWFGKYGVTGNDMIFCGGTVDGKMVHNYGCGLIACADMFLYMAIDNAKYNPTYITGSSIYMDLGHSYEKIRFGDYIMYVTMLSNYFHIYDSPINGIIAEGPLSMTSSINVINFINNMGLSIKWNPCGDNKIKTLNEIKEMTANNIPVIFSYYVFNKDNSLQLYKFENMEYLSAGDDYTITSHYMVATGIIEYSDDVKKLIGHKTMLRVATYGKEFYIDYDKYSEKLSVCSNIMKISK